MKKLSKRFSLILTISIIGVVGFSITASATDSSVPEWVKNNAKWWSEGSISESEYVTSLEFLITEGIIQIPIPITEVTAAQSLLTDDERAQSFVVHFAGGLIDKPVTIETFYKFEATSSQSQRTELYTFPIYKFDDQPTFLLESLPSPDKRDMYIGINQWMKKGQTSTLQLFDVNVDVISGDGRVIQTWHYLKCEPTGYGTFLQDVRNFHQFADQDKSEIRERVTFSCGGIDLEVP